MRRRLLVAAGLMLATAVATGASAAPAPYQVNVLVSETGPGTFLGSQEKQALQVLQTVVNDRGGINGQPIELVFQDDQSNPVIAVQLVNAIIAKGAPVVLGPSLVGSCSAIVPLVEKSGPVHYCFSNALHGPAGGYSFSASAGSAADANVIVRFFRQHGWTRLAFIAANDVSGHESVKQVDDALHLPENRSMSLVASELFNPGSISVDAQLVRIKEQNPQALFTTASGTSFGTILRAMHNAGLDVPTYSSAANMVASQLHQYAGTLPTQLYFAAPSGVIEDYGPATGRVRAALQVYFDAMHKAGLTPSNSATLCWDATTIVLDALAHSGPNPTPEKIHAYIESLHDWAGIEGYYDFRDGSQRGIGEASLLIYRWDPARDRLAIVSRNAGRLR